MNTSCLRARGAERLPQAMDIRTPKPPEGLLDKLSQLPLKYSDPKTLFHGVWVAGDTYFGVFGDGDYGAYEWFTFRADTGALRTSDVGYGSTAFALAEALKQPEIIALL